MHVLLVLNPAAGSLNAERAGVTAEEILAACHAAGLTTTLRPAAPRELRAVLRAARAARPDAIVVGGGDGTIGTAAGELADGDVPLGVLPLGTLNHFARDLGYPTDWRAAVANLAHAQPRAVDLGEVNGRVFINNCSIGAYPEAVRKREALRHRHGAGKIWAMVRASWAVFHHLRRMRLRIESPDTSLALRTPFLVVANNRYAAHVFDESLRPRLDEGRLWLYTTRAHRRLTLLHLLWQSLRRRIDRVDGLEQHEFTTVNITQPRARPLPIAVDGELTTLALPLRFRIRPGALRVLAPVAPQDSGHPSTITAGANAR